MDELERQTRLFDVGCRITELALVNISLSIALEMRRHEDFKDAVLEIQKNTVRRLNFLKAKKKELECVSTNTTATTPSTT